MSAQIKEALAVVRNSFPAFPLDGCLNKRPDVARAMDVIRAALESAQREAEAWEAWEAIEAWCAQDKNTRDIAMGPQARSCGWYLRLLGQSCCHAPFIGKDRLEALEAAAKSCRKEMAK